MHEKYIFLCHKDVFLVIFLEWCKKLQNLNTLIVPPTTHASLASPSVRHCTVRTIR